MKEQLAYGNLRSTGQLGRYPRPCTGVKTGLGASYAGTSSDVMQSMLVARVSAIRDRRQMQESKKLLQVWGSVKIPCRVV